MTAILAENPAEYRTLEMACTYADDLATANPLTKLATDKSWNAHHFEKLSKSQLATIKTWPLEPILNYAPTATPNLLSAIEQGRYAIQKTLMPDTPWKDDRMALNMFAHFVGDAHQPFHCFDNGDELGQNSSIIYNGHAGKQVKTSLHELWDDLATIHLKLKPGASASDVEKAAEEVMGFWPDAMFPTEIEKERNAQVWVKESYLLANDQWCKSGTSLNAEYLKGLKVLGYKRLALAGYRLANELNWTYR